MMELMNNNNTNNDELASTFSEQENVLMKSIFDQQSEYGYLTIDTFLLIIKENWPSNLDDRKLKSLIDYIDPLKQGQINYTQFLNGIKRMMKLSEDNMDSDSSTSLTESTNDVTFNEYDVDTHQHSRQNLSKNNVDENYEDFGTKNESSSSSNEFDSLNTSSHNLLRIPSIKSNLLNSRKRVSELRDFTSTSPNSHITQSSYDDRLSNYDQDQQLLNLENKIQDLESEIEHLKNENSNLKEKNIKLQTDYLNLNEKLHNIEEKSFETERNFNFKLENEKIRQNDQIVKLNNKFNDEKDNFLMQLRRAENEIISLRDENTKLEKQLVELHRSLDSKILNEIQLNEKIKNLKNDYQRIQRERDLYKEDTETIRINSNQRIDILTNENTLLKSQLQETKVRQATSQQEDSIKIKDLELELRQSKNEIILLQAKIQELDAQFIKNSIDAGKQLLLTQTQTLPSLAAEMETLSKDELMEKLNREQEANARYLDYIGQIVARIMEKSPELLEVKPSQPNVKLSKTASVQFSKY